MIYEGYTQLLCENGHLLELDCYDSDNPTAMFSEIDEEDWRCDDCGGKLAWSNQVDETNGGDVGLIELEVDKKGVIEGCSFGGRLRVISHVTYKIPAEGGRKYPKEG